ncbi:MAG: WG repeat-containing protein [Clostridia bacterium]|nr:WG repeat-containing protein [Clostridia bacterium]
MKKAVQFLLIVSVMLMIPAIVYADMLYPIRKNDLWGYMDQQGNIIIDCQFSYAGPFRNAQYAVVENPDSGYGIIDIQGQYCVDPVYEMIIEGELDCWFGGRDQGVNLLFTDTGTAIFDVVTGNVSPADYDVLDIYFDTKSRLMPVNSLDDASLGYLNLDTWELAIPYQFDPSFCGSFYNHITIAAPPEAPDDLILINEQGQTIPLPANTEIADIRISQGRILIQDLDSKLFGFCDTSGALVIPCQYDDAYPFLNDIACVRKGDTILGIDLEGVALFTAESEFQFLFDYAVCDTGAIIDRNGNQTGMIPEDVILINYFDQDGFCLVANADRKIGVLDASGKEIWSAENECELGDTLFYRDIEPEEHTYFHDGLLMLKNEDEKYGFINQQGEVVIPFLYDTAADFDTSLALVEKDGILQYLDTSGSVVWSEKKQ